LAPLADVLQVVVSVSFRSNVGFGVAWALTVPDDLISLSVFDLLQPGSSTPMRSIVIFGLFANANCVEVTLVILRWFGCIFASAVLGRSSPTVDGSLPIQDFVQFICFLSVRVYVRIGGVCSLMT
jgi:hypothetical protein